MMNTHKLYKGITACVLIIVMGTMAGCGENAGSIHPNIAAGMQAVTDRDYQTALANFDAAFAKEENERLAERGKGIAYIGMTDYTAAIESLEKSLRGSGGMLSDMDYDINYYLAAAYTKNQEYAKAEQVYSAILALKPEEANAYYLRGNIWLQMGEYEKAKSDFDKVITLLPNNYDRLIQICEILQNAGYKDAGWAYLEEALETRADKMSSYDKGRIYYYREDYQQACLSLEEAKASGQAEVYLYLGKAYEATGDYNYAVNNVYNAYLGQKEGNAEIYNQLGLCYMKQENYESALAAFQNGISIQDNSIRQTLQFNEIVAYEHLGQYAQALVLIESYLSAYPDDADAIREQGFLATR